MKNLITTFAILFLSLSMFGQTDTENYVKSTTYQVATQDGNVDSNNKVEHVNYLDGLGRAKQSIALRAGGNQEDIITHFEYDEYARQVKEYLPFANSTANGAFEYDALSELNAFYNTPKYENTLNPFSETRLEHSPQNRVLEQGAPGAAWTVNQTSDYDNTIKFDYQSNNTNEVKLFKVVFPNPNDTEIPELLYDGTSYNTGELYKTITKDENWKPYHGKDRTTEEFKDKNGRVILKRTYNNLLPHDTYYVYDDYGNLTFVLPPNLITSPWEGQSFYAEDIPNIYASEVEYHEISVRFIANVLNVSMYAEGAEEIELEDGGEVALNTFNPPLPDMYLGEIFFENGQEAGDAYINSGTLFIGSSGIAGDWELGVNFQVDLSSYISTLPSDISQADLDALAYQYRYDHRNRLVEKKIPGKDWEYIVYNKLNQPVMTQDANLRTQNRWLFTKYDAFGRVAYTGYTNNSGNRAYMVNVMENAAHQYENRLQNAISLGGTQIFYTNQAKPIGATEIYTVNYYDDYDIGSQITFNPANGSGTWEGMSVSTDIKGLATVSRVKALTTNNWITTATYYDEKRRPWEIHIKNDYLDTEDWILNKLDFAGKVLKTSSSHTKTGQPTITTIDNFSYDHIGRLLTHTQNIEGEGVQLIADNEYDELGQLEKKHVGGSLTGYEDLVNVTINSEANTIKSTASGWGSSGLATEGSIASGSDGYVEFTPIQANKAVMVGLSPTNSSAHYNTIKYAIYARYDGAVRVYENSQYKGTFGSYSAGDVFRVERIGNSILYKVNGDTRYVSTVPSIGQLLGDVAFGHSNGTIKDLILISDNSGLQTVDYAYNIRGWLKQVNDPNVGNLDDDLFSFKLKYNEGGLYNGNISEVLWTTASDHVSRKYRYYYDDLNRITNAYFYLWNQHYRFDLRGVSYDKNGNILGLTRRGAIVENPDITTSSHFGTMDNLTYEYIGNQLTKVSDSSNDTYGFKDGTNTNDDYTYDANGNMTTDQNKGISTINYNHLNLPTSIEVEGDEFGTISYVYDANGTKLSKTIEDQPGIPDIVTTYAGNYIYENNELQLFSQPEGYVEPNNSGGFDHVFQYKDHLGNIRLSYKENQDNQEEIVFSDGFESASGWDGSGNSWGHPISSFDSNFKRTGNYSGFIDRPGNDDSVHSNDWTIINNTEDTFYTFSGWVYLEDTPNHRSELYLFMKTNEETGYYTEINFASTSTRGQWVKIEKSVLVPQHIDKLNIRVTNRNAGKLWVDDIKIVKGNTSKTLIVEENNYYPFGLKHKGYNNVVSANSNSVASRFKFNGQEFSEDLGLNVSEMIFRQYDPSIGRFNVIDRVAELAPSITPYRFGFNNPVLFNDPTGLYESVGADGLTNSQWLEASRPGANRNLYSTYRDYNRQKEIEQNRNASVFPEGEVDFFADGKSGDEVFRIYDVNKPGTVHIYHADWLKKQFGNTVNWLDDNQQTLGLIAGYIGTTTSFVSETMTLYTINGFKSARNPVAFHKLRPTQINWRLNNRLGKNGAKLLKVAKGTGVLASAVSVGVSGYKIYEGTATTIDYVDTGVGLASIGAAVFLASNPVGWAISAGAAIYFAGRLAYDLLSEED